MKLSSAFIFLVFSGSLFAETYSYRSLIIKDYDEMRQMVLTRIKKAKVLSDGTGDDSEKDAGALEHLRDAMKLILSRPDNDNMVAKLTPEVKRELAGFSAYADTISSLAAESLGLVKNKNTTVTQQSTALFILENIIREVRPEAATNPDLRAVLERIVDADVSIPEDVVKDRKMNSMYATVNPSAEARKILRALPKAKPVKAQ